MRTAGTPAAGALPATTTTFTYEDRTQRPVALSVSQGIDVATRYSLTGKPLELEFSNNGCKKSWVTNTYEWGTQRLATAEVTC